MKIEYLPEGSPDCPLIRIYGDDQIGMRDLRAAIRDLITGAKETIDLHRISSFAAAAACELKLRIASALHHEGVRQQAGTLDFEWALTVPEWESVADLIEPLAEHPEQRGYQWLHDRAGEILVLLSSYGDGQW